MMMTFQNGGIEMSSAAAIDNLAINRSHTRAPQKIQWTLFFALGPTEKYKKKYIPIENFVFNTSKQKNFMTFNFYLFSLRIYLCFVFLRACLKREMLIKISSNFIRQYKRRVPIFMYFQRLNLNLHSCDGRRGHLRWYFNRKGIGIMKLVLFPVLLEHFFLKNNHLQHWLCNDRHN